MTALVGKAQEDDDDFWGGLGGQFFGGNEIEPSEDEDFTSNAES